MTLGRNSVPGHSHLPWDAGAGEPALDLRGIYTLIHSAAFVPPDMTDATHACRCVEVNALGTLALIKAAQACGVARFVLISSANIIERRSGPIPDDAYPAHHHTQAAYYLTSKLLAETYVQAEAERIGTLIVRPSSIYGPGSPGGALDAILGRLERNETVIIRDGGRYTADYVFVDDVATLLARAALSPMRGFLNAGSGVATDLLGVLELAQACVPDSISRIVIDPPAPARPAGGFSALDIRRAHAAFDYRPRTLDQGLALLRAPQR